RALVRQRPCRPVVFGVQVVDEGLPEQVPHLALRADLLGGDVLPEPVDHLLGPRGPEVGHDERVLDLLPRVLVQVAGAEQPQQALADGVLGPREPPAESLETAGRRVDPLDRGDRLGSGGDLIRRGRGDLLLRHLRGITTGSTCGGSTTVDWASSASSASSAASAGAEGAGPPGDAGVVGVAGVAVASSVASDGDPGRGGGAWSCLGTGSFSGAAAAPPAVNENPAAAW